MQPVHGRMLYGAPIVLHIQHKPQLVRKIEAETYFPGPVDSGQVVQGVALITFTCMRK